MPIKCENDDRHEKVLPLTVLSSAAGWYVGRFCPECGPYSRESCYFPSFDEAADYLRIYADPVIQGLKEEAVETIVTKTSTSPHEAKRIVESVLEESYRELHKK